MGVTYGTFQARRRDGGAAEKRHMRCGRGREICDRGGDAKARALLSQVS